MVEEENVQAQQKEVVVKKEESVEKRNTERTLKIFSIVIGISLILALVIIKLYNPDFSLVAVIIIGVLIILLSAFIFFSFTIFRNFGKKEKEEVEGLPKPAKLIDLRRIAEGALTNEFYGNHVRGCKGEKFFNIGKSKKSRIYVYKTEALYKDDMNNGNIFIIINSHYPEDLRNILIDPTPHELAKAINSLSLEPEEEAEIEEILTVNPLTGTEQVKRHVGRPTKEEEKKKKEGDLE